MNEYIVFLIVMVIHLKVIWVMSDHWDNIKIPNVDHTKSIAVILAIIGAIVLFWDNYSPWYIRAMEFLEKNPQLGWATIIVGFLGSLYINVISEGPLQSPPTTQYQSPPTTQYQSPPTTQYQTPAPSAPEVQNDTFENLKKNVSNYCNEVKERYNSSSDEEKTKLKKALVFVGVAVLATCIPVIGFGLIIYVIYKKGDILNGS